jgi:hypothetical protein
MHHLLGPVSGHYTCYVFGRLRVHISPRKPVILTDVFHRISVFLRADLGTIPYIRSLQAYFHILTNSLFACHPFIWRCIVWITQKASLNKLILQLLCKIHPLFSSILCSIRSFLIWRKFSTNEISHEHQNFCTLCEISGSHYVKFVDSILGC